MTAEQIGYYAACDRMIRAMDRMNVEAFGRLKTADWDEVNIIRTVTAVYRKSAKEAKRRYYEVAFEAYLIGMALCGEDPKKAHETAEEAITESWVGNVLEEADPVTLYRFNAETERKAYRLAETLEVSRDRNGEIDKALKQWSRQVGQYAINMTDYAVIQAFQDAGIMFVEWVTMADERVCGKCRPLNGQVFPIDEIPPKHWGCRCRLKPVRDVKQTDV